jgi:hypothetical protein
MGSSSVTGAREPDDLAGACDVDVISQGREPKRDFRLPLSRRWRAVAGCAVVLAVAAVLMVTSLRLRHDGRAASAAAASPTAPAPVQLTRTRSQPDFVVCSPSRAVCSYRLIIVNGTAYRLTQVIARGH